MRNAPDKKHRPFFARLLTAICALFFAGLLPGIAWSTDFLAGERNRAPVSGLFLLNATDVPRTDSWQADWITASHSARDTSGSDEVLFDGETSILALRHFKIWSPRWSTSVNVPYVWHSGGALDGFIDAWHDTFGLPNGIRDERPDDSLALRYQRDSNAVIDIQRNQKGIGDITLGARRQLGASDGPWSLLLGLKLPTGDTESLTGSGGTDVSAALAWQRGSTDSAWQFDINVGAALLGDSDLELQGANDAVAFGSASVSRRITNRLTLGGRLQIHGAPATEGPGPISDTAVGLALGGQLELSRHWLMTIVVSEDLSVEALPDVTFRLGIGFRQ